MTWGTIKLNDGHEIPGIGFGTWRIPQGQSTTDQVDQAISVGFNHVDTAQAYRNEEEAGKAIRESGLAREEIFLTTKYSGTDGLDIETSIKNSLKNLGVAYIDLYLIHHPRLAIPDIPTAWRQLEGLRESGLVKSIGVSNFTVPDLQILLNSAKIVPAVNQIPLHPLVYKQQKPILDFAKDNNIAIEAYSTLSPLTQRPGCAVTRTAHDIAKYHGVAVEEVFLAWAKAKGAIVLTTSSKEARLKNYLAAGELGLSDKDVDKIDQAGKRQRWGEAAINFVMWAVAFAVFWNIWVIIGALYPDWVPTAERLWD